MITRQKEKEKENAIRSFWDKHIEHLETMVAELESAAQQNHLSKEQCSKTAALAVRLEKLNH